MNDLVRDITSEGCVSLEDAEVLVSEASRSWGQKFLEMFVSQMAGEQTCEPVECPEREQVCRPWCPRARRRTTVCGVIRVERWVYHCASGHTHVPWEAEQKLRGQYTHRVAEAMCRMASCFDFRAAAKELFRQGIQVSHTTLHQKVGEWQSHSIVGIYPDEFECLLWLCGKISECVCYFSVSRGA